MFILVEMYFMMLQSTRTIKNGGIEQAILEAVNEDGLLNEADKKRLEYLQSLPQNRVEIINEYNIKTKEEIYETGK